MQKNDVYDCIVLGLGAMGSAALYQLAKRRVQVLGLDQFDPPHPWGSTHGGSRITRQAIGEGEAYVPLVLRSYKIWAELEAASGQKLLTITGGLQIGPSEGETSWIHGQTDFLGQTVALAQRFGIKHRLLNNADLRREFPQFRVQDHERAYYEDEAGVLNPEACVATQLKLARRLGAAVQTLERVERVTATAGGVRLETNRGVYNAGKLIVSAGAWIGQILPEFAVTCQVYRQVMHWFAVDGALEPFLPGRFPVFIWTFNRSGEEGIYGFPALDGRQGGVKVATEAYEVPTAADTVERAVSQEEIATMHRTRVAPFIVGLSARSVKAVSCLYTLAPGWRFIIGEHPKRPNVVVASPCSGHGFKHSAAVGEALAEQLVEGRSQIELAAFAVPTVE